MHVHGEDTKAPLQSEMTRMIIIIIIRPTELVFVLGADTTREKEKGRKVGEEIVGIKTKKVKLEKEERVRESTKAEETREQDRGIRGIGRHGQV